MRSTKLRPMTQCALLLAMGTVLSLIPIIEMPFGGTVTLMSMLPICMAGILHGPAWGFGTAFTCSVIQLMLSKCFAWGLSPTVLIVCILADYIVAFTVLGVTAFFRGSRGRICTGIMAAVSLRLCCHYISGVTIWAEMAPEGWNAAVYSLVYNGFYMLPEMALTLAGAMVITAVPQMWRLMGIAN